ncbi:TIGR04282 family arsenosugar biosynthesis glycosyltransferase [Nocardia carnea]|uniref:Glycosyltransferase n=1 Tax=Nocardia carnea TaxID=37328 RepID=A0ABW7TSW6_9NOCA|nr:hypothetical protein [Nocardia carnea]
MIPVTVLVVAKAPVPGFAKTRLCPPLTPVQAARPAAAALLDTLDAVRVCPVVTRMVAFAGDLGTAELGDEIGCALAGFDVKKQRGSGFGTRLANAHADAARAGLAADGGWWALGLTDPRAARLLADVPMSTSRTGEATRNALRDSGYRIGTLPTLTDVDRYTDAVAVAADCTGRFAAEVRALGGERVAR